MGLNIARVRPVSCRRGLTVSVRRSCLGPSSAPPPEKCVCTSANRNWQTYGSTYYSYSAWQGVLKGSGIWQRAVGYITSILSLDMQEVVNVWVQYRGTWQHAKRCYRNRWEYENVLEHSYDRMKIRFRYAYIFYQTVTTGFGKQW
jgi:hypothetical protein